MSEAVAASGDTAMLGWLLLLATSDGDGAGAAGDDTIAGGVGVGDVCAATAGCFETRPVWSAAMRAPPASRLAPAAAGLRCADAAFTGAGAGLLFVAAAGVSTGLVAAGAVAGAAAAGRGP